MRLKHLKFLKILNRAGKRVVSLLGAVALIALNVIPALASSHVDVSNMSREETQDYVHGTSSVFDLSVDIPKSELSNIVSFLNCNNNQIPGRKNSTGELSRFGSRLENIVNNAPCSLSNIVYDYFVFGNDEQLAFVWFYYVKNDNAKFSVENGYFTFSDKCFYGKVSYKFNSISNKYEYSTAVNSCVDYVEIPYHSIAYSQDFTCFYYSNNASVPALNFDTNSDGSILFESPEPWLYDVTYSPVLTDELEQTKYIDVTISLDDKTIKFLNSNPYLYRIDILPYISSVSASDNFCISFDNALAVSPYRSYFYDKYTVQAGSWGNNHVIGTYNNDKCLGTNILYSLNDSNNYSTTVRFSITDTSLVSGHKYFINVVGIMSSDLWYKTSDTSVPNRALFRQLYEDFSSGNLSSWADDSLRSFRVMDSSSFSLTNLLRKTSRDDIVNDGLMSSNVNSLNHDPSIIKDVAGSGNDLAFSEVEDYNNQQAEDYVESAPDKELSGFSLSGLLSTLKYSDEFLGFLSYGFSILPIQIWSLIKFSIVAVCFVGIVKTVVHQ